MAFFERINMTTFILAEKEKQGRSYMDALGIKYANAHSAYGRGSTFLDDDTVVIGAEGHLFELAEPEQYDPKYKDRLDLSLLPIFPQQFKYEIRKNLINRFNLIKGQANHADRIIVATDKDNEGGAIAFNILLMSGVVGKKDIVRAYPNSLDKPAIVRTFKHLEPIQQTWRDADAAIARGKSDWLIGMNLSRLYTSKLKDVGIYGNFAVGRAISSTLKLICLWYRAIETFKEQPTYSLNDKTKLPNGSIIKLTSGIKTVGTDKTDPKVEMHKALNDHQLKPKMYGIVKESSSSQKNSYPTKLLTKAGLYTEMSRVAGWSQKKSEKVMQDNYEQGYQTYPRTDSPKITMEDYKYLCANFDSYMSHLGMKDKYQLYKLPSDKLSKYLSKEASSGAHTAIIPTQKVMPSKEEEQEIIKDLKAKGKESDYTLITDDQRIMWEVVTRRTMTILLPPYTYISNKLVVGANDVDFSVTNSAMLNNGWKDIVLPKNALKKGRKSSATKTKKEESTFDFSKVVHKDDQLPLILNIEQGKTVKPKPLKDIQIYGDNGLMEKAYEYVDDPRLSKLLKKVQGIGTSATKDTIVDSLVQKEYITLNSQNVITVTAKGWLMYTLMKNSLVSDPSLSAKWEAYYDQISKGKANAQDLVNATAKLILTEISRVNKKWNKDKITGYYQKRQQIFNQTLSIGTCPICNKGNMVYEKFTGKGKDGTNLSTYNGWKCDNPDCKFKIWQHFANISFTQTDAKRLLNGDKTRVIRGIIGQKSHKKYDAAFQLKQNKKTGKVTVSPIFEDKWVGEKRRKKPRRPNSLKNF